MSFTEGLECQFKSGEVVSKITDKYGSFIVFVWPEGAGGASASFSISKNNQHCNIRRLSCVKGADGEYFDPSISTDGIHWNLSNGLTGSTFNIKVLG